MKKLQLLLFLLIFLSANFLYGKAAISAVTDKVGTELPQSKVKKILIITHNSQFIPYGSKVPIMNNLAWYLNDPLILSETNIEVSKASLSEAEYLNPDYSILNNSSYDLVIVPFPHHIKTEYFTDILRFVNNGGALFLVQPTFDSTEQATLLWENLGVTFTGWEDSTPASSLLTDHPATRILGLPEGQSVYPHRMYQPHMKFDAGNGTVLTRLSYAGDPDLFITSNGSVAIVTTDIIGDFLSTDPEFPAIEKNFRYIFINTIRSLLGLEFFVQPVQQPQQKWSELFYAYAASREYIMAAGDIEVFSERLPGTELRLIVERADRGVGQAAKVLVQGNYEECKVLFYTSVKLLSECMDKMTNVDRFFIRGWHSSILTPYYYGGGLLGYAEVEWQDHLINWMKKQLDWITRTGSRRLIDVFPHDWEILAPYYPEEINLFKVAIKDGRLEAVNGMFSAAYLPILSEESNVRQFRYGLNGFKKVLDADVETFICPSDHFDFHPQLPQILNNFGYKNALVNEAGMGTLSRIQADIINWRGLNGTEIEAIPQLKGITDRRNWFNPASVAEADQLGYRSVVIGIPSIDATLDLIGERESSLINPIAPIAGTWVSAKELFERAPEPKNSFYLSVDELWANKIDTWSSWGWMNEASEWNRTTENKILAAEKFSVIATVLGKTSADYLKSSQEKFDESWKILLRTQDHMLYGSVDYTDQVPPAILKPGEEKRGKHAWGYDFPLLHDSLHTIGAMDNYCETRAANIGSPRIPGSRYDRTKSFIKESQDISGAVLNEALGSILGGENVQDNKERIIPVTVFNQLGWQKRGIVALEKEFREGEISHFVLFEGKKEIPYQVTSLEKYGDGSIKKIKALFLAEIPSLGYKTYFIKPASKEPSTVTSSSLKASPTRLENDYYIVEINAEDGGVSRIFDKELGIEMISDNKIGNELYSPEDPVASSTAGQAKIELVEKGPVRMTIRVNSQIDDAPYQCSISLYNSIKRIDFDLHVDYGRAGLNFGSFKKRETGLYVRFPVNFTGKLHINQPFGLYETGKDRQVTLDFADLYQGQYGLSLIHRNSPSYHYKDGILSICLTRGRPFVVGDQNYQYSIYTHKEDPFEGDAYNIAKSVNTPFVVYWPETQVEERSQTLSFLTIDKPNIVLSALYSEGDTIYARFYERSGKATTASIEMPYLKSDECMQVKLNKEKIQTVKCTRGKIKLDFKPWEIVTLAFPRDL